MPSSHYGVTVIYKIRSNMGSIVMSFGTLENRLNFVSTGASIARALILVICLPGKTMSGFASYKFLIFCQFHNEASSGKADQL